MEDSPEGFRKCQSNVREYKNNNKFIFVLNLAIKSGGGGGRTVEEVPYGLDMCATLLPAQPKHNERNERCFRSNPDGTTTYIVGRVCCTALKFIGDFYYPAQYPVNNLVRVVIFRNPTCCHSHIRIWNWKRSWREIVASTPALTIFPESAYLLGFISRESLTLTHSNKTSRQLNTRLFAFFPESITFASQNTCNANVPIAYHHRFRGMDACVRCRTLTPFWDPDCNA